MKTLDKAINTLSQMAVASRRSVIDPRIRLAVTLVYVGVVLSVPTADPARLVWMFVFPIVVSEASGIGYGRVFMRSLWVLPLIALIGIFNPVVDRQTWWVVGDVVVSRGWVSFISIVLRGLLAMQALLVLVMSMGFYDVCRSLQAMGCPAILATQLVMIYRYMGVLLEEARTMHRARESRGFGRRSYPLSMWGTFVGQLLVRSIHRSRRVNAAMESRGFDGTYRWGTRMPSPGWQSWVWLTAWLAVFAALRLVDFTTLSGDIIMRNLH